MKFSYNWIRELVDGLDASPADLMRLITIKTAECEGVEETGGHFASVVKARVLSVESMGESHNRKATIDAGGLGKRTVVCGAPNCRPGLITAYVPAGTSLDGKQIGRRVVEGVESDGMLASGAEIGLNRDHEGIVELEGAPGEPVDGCVPDAIIEVDNKSLTHRPDLWGHHGMAREVAAITGSRLREPADCSRIDKTSSPINVSIENFELCPRYSALVFENVNVRPSPPWLQYRLQAVGLNPINNIVDVTNYVMAELAQPMHAFDADKLTGGAIVVRNAREGETIAALNGESYALTPAALLITDAQGPIAIAGVIGGMDSSISGSTTRIVLESACFHAACIRRTSSRLKLRTDASMRFEKSQDPVNTERGLARALELLMMVSPGIRLVGGMADCAASPKPRTVIDLPMDWLRRKLGREIEQSEVVRILKALMFVVDEPEPGLLRVTVPSWRATKDISIKDDLVEEVGRMIGYATITPIAPATPTTPPPANARRKLHRELRQLVSAQGFDEVYNYSFFSEDAARRFGLDPAAHCAVANPISTEQSLMRMSLVPGIWRNIQDNARHFGEFRIFEIGSEIHKQDGDLPNEIPHLVAAVFQHTKETGPFYEIKRLAECVLPGCVPQPSAARDFEHPSRAAELAWRGKTVGRVFEFHPQMVEGRAVVLDIDLGVVEELGPEGKRYRPIRRFPSSAFDLSVIAARRALSGDLETALRRLAGPMLESIEFLRQYEGEPLAAGEKSVSFRLTIASSDHTLSNEETTAVRDAVIQGMRELGFEMRV
ncbi:MAG: phenylalanine--tRNA ligase subunit beta [Candidatus Solibacter usitatus]|nr:phenylalanine--tRNA ligase subunit beta [Candidatus Solibacter usitatus]